VAITGGRSGKAAFARLVPGKEIRDGMDERVGGLARQGRDEELGERR